MQAADLEGMRLSAFVELAAAELLAVYKRQRGMLHLVHAMYAVPELRDLDNQHDERVISEMATMFTRIGLDISQTERGRLARLWLEMTHALLLTIVEQRGIRSSKSRADLVHVCEALLSKHS